MDQTSNSSPPTPAAAANPVQRITAEQLAAAARLRDYWTQRHLASRLAAAGSDENNEQVRAT
jgi:hypothetical protein